MAPSRGARSVCLLTRTGDAVTLYAIEVVARKVYEQEVGHSSFCWALWEELSEDEREDVRHQVRIVLDVVESLTMPKIPGLLGLPPPLPALPAVQIRGNCGTDVNQTRELQLLTGT
jgi:hypothetical protein